MTATAIADSRRGNGSDRAAGSATTLLLIALATGCGPRSAAPASPPVAATELPAPTAPLAGSCFDLVVEDWRGDRALLSDSLAFSPPPRVLLDTAGPAPRLSRIHGARLLRPAPGALPSAHRFAFWRPLEGDSVEMRWSTGFVGLHARLARRGPDLGGSAETFTDAMGQEQAAASMIAMRVDCDAPLPEAHRFRYRYPRGIAVEGADSLRLGESLDRSGLDVVGGNPRAIRIGNRPLDEWAGADSLVVFPGEGRIETIWLTYPEGSYDEVYAQLEAALGTPTNRAPAQGEGCLPHAFWIDRTTVIQLAGEGADGCGLLPRVRIRGNRTP